MNSEVGTELEPKTWQSRVMFNCIVVAPSEPGSMLEEEKAIRESSVYAAVVYRFAQRQQEPGTYYSDGLPYRRVFFLPSDKAIHIWLAFYQNDPARETLRKLVDGTKQALLDLTC
jgi:hypothetical protein